MYKTVPLDLFYVQSLSCVVSVAFTHLQLTLSRTPTRFDQMLPQVAFLSFFAVFSAASAATAGPRRLDRNGPFHSHARSDIAASKTVNRRAAGAPVTPPDWPTTTQAGATPSVTAVTSADPYLNSLSYALNNAGNSLWTATYSGDLTYVRSHLRINRFYNPSLLIRLASMIQLALPVGTSILTATISLLSRRASSIAGLVSKRVVILIVSGFPHHLRLQTLSSILLFATGNPVCGPWTPGRQVQNQVTGVWETVVSSSDGTMQ